MRSIACMTGPLSGALHERFATTPSTVTALTDAASDPETVVFVDAGALAELEQAGEPVIAGPVIAVCDGPGPTAIGWLAAHPWLSHVVSSAMLQHAMAAELFDNVVATLATSGRSRPLLDWVRHTLTGRRISLTHASQRAERIERMGAYFESLGVGAATVELLGAAAGELLANAFYDAPFEAGASKQPLSRDGDVVLPEDTPCEMVYGCTDQLALIRVRDPFGALSRTRILGSAETSWRIFSMASLVAISVANHHHTDVLIGLGKTHDAEPPPFAFHLFFKDGAKRRFWQSRDDEHTGSSFITSVTDLGDPG